MRGAGEESIIVADLARSIDVTFLLAKALLSAPNSPSWTLFIAAHILDPLATAPEPVLHMPNINEAMTASLQLH